MAVKSGCRDYLDDIPMEIGTKFFPPPTIRLPTRTLPKLSLPECNYPLDAEYRAREQFENGNKPQVSPSQTPTAAPRTSPPTKISSFSKSQEVLIPSQMSSNKAESRVSPPIPPRPTIHQNLVEFESQPTVFDDLELSALDEKAVLFDILSSTSYNGNSSVKQSFQEVTPAPPPVLTPPPSLRREDNASIRKRQKEEEMRKRLADKGFRRDIIEKTIATLPYNRLVHVEYYMKGARTMEKTGKATVDEGLRFLNQANLTDKQKILKYADDAAHLLSMGFVPSSVFQTLIELQGDQMKTMEKLLAK